MLRLPLALLACACAPSSDDVFEPPVDTGTAAPAVEECRNDADDDGDGQIDCDDPDCADRRACRDDPTDATAGVELAGDGIAAGMVDGLVFFDEHEGGRPTVLLADGPLDCDALLADALMASLGEGRVLVFPAEATGDLFGDAGLYQVEAVPGGHQSSLTSRYDMTTSGVVDDGDWFRGEAVFLRYDEGVGAVSWVLPVCGSTSAWPA